MIALKQGEKVRTSVEVNKSKHGKGVFYVSNLGVSFETQKHGIIIDLSYEWLRSFQAVKKDKIMIVWDNEADQRLSYEMKVDSAEQLVHEITAANEEYSKTLSETDTMKRFENPSNDELISQPIFTIPDYVSKDKIWNDCWFDEKRNVYVTHNRFFEKIPDVRKRDHQIEYEKESGDNGLITQPNKIRFFYGYPAVHLTVNDDGTKRWILLSTMTDDMITQEIVNAFLKIDPAQHWIYYTTISHRIHKFGTGIELNNKEYELGKDSGKYVYVPLPEHMKQ